MGIASVKPPSSPCLMSTCLSTRSASHAFSALVGLTRLALANTCFGRVDPLDWPTVSQLTNLKVRGG